VLLYLFQSEGHKVQHGGDAILSVALQILFSSIFLWVLLLLFQPEGHKIQRADNKSLFVASRKWFSLCILWLLLYLFQSEGHKVQHRCELAEHDGFGRGVRLQHLVHFFPQSLNLGAALEICGLDATQDAALLAAESPHRRLQSQDVQIVVTAAFIWCQQ